MKLFITTSDVNLGKLVPLEVHSRLKNAKIAKGNFPMSEWGVPYTVGKLKRRAFQQAKEHANKNLWLEKHGPRKSRDCPEIVSKRPSTQGEGWGPEES